MKLPYPPEVFDEAVAIIGKIGSGKTFAAKSAIESLLDQKQRVVILDPTGVWWGLKSSADGKREGYEVAIFGGTHADMQITEASAVPLAKAIATNNLPSIIDVSEFSVAGRTRFATAFLDELYSANPKQPLTIVFDEADMFAPQQPMPNETTMYNRVETIVLRGRARGFRVWMITPRPARLNKSVLSQAGTLIAMKLTSPQDRNAVGAWIEGQADRDAGKKLLADLARLERGDGFVWCPSKDFLQRVRFPMIKTFDSSRTPKHGENVPQPTKLSHVDLSGLIEALKPVEPKKEKTAREYADRDTFEQTRQIEYTRGYKAGHEHGYKAGQDAAKNRFDAALTRFRDEIKVIDNTAKTAVAPVPRIVTSTVPAGQYTKVASTRTARTTPPTDGLSSAEQRIFDSLSWWHAAGVTRPSRHQVAFVANYTVNGHFNNMVGSLKGKGLVTYPGNGDIELAVEPSAPAEPVSREALIEKVRAVLKGEPVKRVFSALVQAVETDRFTLASMCGYTENGHFNNIVGELKTLGVAVYPSKGRVALSSMFGDLA